MMDVNVNSLADVRLAGVKALLEAIGPVGYVRFMQQFENGYGDYTKEKYLRPEPTFEELDSQLRAYV